jgi:nucleoside-diphosphate-sugar epimerase
MKVLVTGATGGLGRNLVERLVREGKSVVATGRNPEFGKALRNVGADFVPADICDVASVARLAKDCETVYHCAALASPWGDYHDFFDANVVGTESAISAALRAKAKLVHVSTPSIYFDYRSRLDIREEDPLPRRFVNAYAATKYEAERRVGKAVIEAGLVAVILRPRAIFGPHDSALFPRVLAALRNGRLPVAGRGHTLIDVTCVSNLVDAMLLSSDRAEELTGRTYNITNGKPILLRDLLEIAFNAMDIQASFKPIPYPVLATAATLMEAWAKTPFAAREPVLTRYSAGVLRYHQTLNIDRARAELGYTPRITTVRGVNEYAEWRRNNAD